MKAPPNAKGAGDALTPSTPNRVSIGNRNSPRKYFLNRREVNPQEADAESRVSANGVASAEAPPTVGRFSAAEQRFFELCQQLSGRELPPDTREKKDRDRALLLAQSYQIADALESQGIKAYGDTKITMVGILSGKIVEMPDFRNIVFIPAIAQRKRHRLLKQLEYYVQEHRYSRMWVFTTGERTPLPNVRERIGWLHRRLSKLNAQPFMKAAGVSIVFRSTELGEMVRDIDGESTFHVHAHVIVTLKNRLAKEQWSLLLTSVRNWWKFHFKEARKVEGVRETCKYVVKPGELEQLTAPELAELHHQLFKLHLVQCLGELKEQRKNIEETDCQLVRIPDPVNSRWEMLPNWNRKKQKGDGEAKSYENPPVDWILCLLPPSHAVSDSSEPLAVVLNYKGERLESNPRIRAVRQSCAPSSKLT